MEKLLFFSVVLHKICKTTPKFNFVNTYEVSRSMNLKLFRKYCSKSVPGAAVYAVEQHWAIVRVHILKSH